MSDPTPETPAPGTRGRTPGRTPRRAVRPASRGDEPVPPEQTSDDTDAGGGDWREGVPDDDERYLRERPPHW